MCNHNQFHIGNTQGRTLWMACILFLFLYRLSSATGTSLSPWSSDGVWEVPANQEARFTCTAEGPVFWILRTETSGSLLLAEYVGKRWTLWTNAGGVFTPSTVDAHRTAMTINPVNKTNLYKYIHLLNASLECTGKDFHNRLTHYQLNYVYPANDVSCTAVNTSWSVTVSCVIRSVYSSRRVYTCQLYRHKNEEKNETLETVTMFTSPTRKSVTRNEVKVSGVCQFITTLPVEEGNYRFYVSISPGGRSYAVEIITGQKWITVERPHAPNISCNSQPHVLENTDITCVCGTTSLGQPMGTVVWVTGGTTSQGRLVTAKQEAGTSQGLRFTQTLTLSDQRTWFRCDVIWWTEQIPGENYTASVGYAAQPTRFSIGSYQRNQKVREGDQVQFVCESDGRPSPYVYIANHDNDSVIWSDSSPASFTFIARCQDTATYRCSAWNAYSKSKQPDLTTSHYLSLYVLCKPRDHGTSGFNYKTRTLSFDVIAYPVPHGVAVWLAEPSGNKTEATFEVPVVNVTCEVYPKLQYLSRCTLNFINISSMSPTDFYKVQLINDAGVENFDVEAIFRDKTSLFCRESRISRKICAWLLGVELTCPSLFKSGQNTVTCRINKSAVEEAKCSEVQRFVIFEDTISDKALCLVQSFNLSDCHPRSPAPNACWCSSSDGNIFEYEHTFMVNPAQDVELQCTICALPENFLENTIRGKCKSKTSESGTAALAGAHKLTMLILILAVITAKLLV